MRAFLCLLVVSVACHKAAPDESPPRGSAATPSPTSTPTSTSTSSSPGYDAAALGALKFEVTGGSPEARTDFTHGLLALHSFWYDEATRQFEAAITADPTFSMAYWGLAMSKAKLLWGDDDLDGGRDALKRMPNANKLSPREQAWVVAALSLFRRADADVRASRADFLKVMEQVNAKFPDDESALFLALALLSTVQAGDPNEVAIRTRAGELAMKVYEHNPNHPGAAHYIIHAFDTPDLAPRALPAARAYAKIAPAAFHAQHMPAHIFVRLGMWDPAVASCQAAWDASVAWVERDKLSIDHEDFHSLAWLVELNFERGQRAAAEVAMKRYGDAVRAGLPADKRAAYANQVASFLARTGEWSKVDEYLAPLEAPAVMPAAGGGMACGHAPAPVGAPNQLFEKRAVLATRALAAAMLHDPAAVTRFLDQRDGVDAELRPFLLATQPKAFVESGDKLRAFVRASLIARAKQDDRALVAALKPLAVDEDTEFTGEGTAGGMLDHEQIAEALVRLGQPKQALAQYELVLAQHPGRARSLLGAARVTTKLGDTVTASTFYKKLAAIWSSADVGTPGLDEVRSRSLAK
jgi:tetratricopeptide (TPR) repeat protein